MRVSLRSRPYAQPWSEAFADRTIKDFVADLFELLIGATCRMEGELIAASDAAATPPAGGRPSAADDDSRAPAREPQEA